MSKIFDITDKLDFEESPRLVIKGEEYVVNDDATTMLKIMQKLGDGADVSGADIIAMYELILPEKERQRLDKLKLKFKDFQTVVMAAIDLASGAGDDTGE